MRAILVEPVILEVLDCGSECRPLQARDKASQHMRPEAVPAA